MAAKGQYLAWLPKLMELMPPGALLVSDNVLQDGDIVQSRFAVERRNRTIHARHAGVPLRIKAQQRAGDVHPSRPGDGVALSVRRR